MEIIITRIIENFLLPPGINFIMMLLGYFLLRRYYRTALFLMLSGFFTLILFSLPITAHFLDYPNNNIKPLTAIELANTDAKAIIILGGGRYRKAPEFGKDTVSNSTLTRIRYGAYLHRTSKLPILVTGGKVYGDGLSEAELMRRSLQDDFNVSTKWIEEKSRNTNENAEFSFYMLAEEKIHTIILVTNFSHIKRSQAIFKKVGFKVIPAPLDFQTDFENRPLILSLIPSDGLNRSRAVLREYMGQLWYLLRY